jgi:hypothetical protein
MNVPTPDDDGDDDQIVLYVRRRSWHGMPTTEVETINADLTIKCQRNGGTGASAPTPNSANTYRSTLAPGASGVKASRKNDFRVR